VTFDPKEPIGMVTKRLPIRRGKATRAFTLIELLIVGALIALFAGLAIFGAQQAYLDNQRKAMIGEARQVATSLDMAYADVNFFPALCFLDKSLTNLFVTAQQAGGLDNVNNGEDVLQFMHIYLLPTSSREQLIRRDWGGPYFAASQARSGVSQGRGGSREMELVNPSGTRGTYSWPLDAYGNPYMVYDLNVDRTTGILSFNLTDQFNTGNFATAVVSYGRNRIPGGPALHAPTDPLIAQNLRLYDGNLNDTGATLRYDVSELASDGAALAGAWTTETGTPPLARMATDIDTGDEIGITDPGSDDIVFTF
jgi:type II secretory pathway pseudopilin PulG